MAYDNDRFRIGLDFGQHGFEFFGANAEFVREAVIADKISMAGDGGLCPTSSLGLVILGGIEEDVQFLRMTNHSLGEWVRRVRVNRGGDAEDVRCGRAVEGNHVEHSGFSFGDGASLIHRQEHASHPALQGMRRL